MIVCNSYFTVTFRSRVSAVRGVRECGEACASGAAVKGTARPCYRFGTPTTTCTRVGALPVLGITGSRVASFFQDVFAIRTSLTRAYTSCMSRVCAPAGSMLASS